VFGPGSRVPGRGLIALARRGGVPVDASRGVDRGGTECGLLVIAISAGRHQHAGDAQDKHGQRPRFLQRRTATRNDVAMSATSSESAAAGGVSVSSPSLAAGGRFDSLADYGYACRKQIGDRLALDVPGLLPSGKSPLSCGFHLPAISSHVRHGGKNGPWVIAPRLISPLKQVPAGSIVFRRQRGCRLLNRGCRLLNRGCRLLRRGCRLLRSAVVGIPATRGGQQADHPDQRHQPNRTPPRNRHTVMFVWAEAQR